jgi:hypothetical protein
LVTSSNTPLRIQVRTGADGRSIDGSSLRVQYEDREASGLRVGTPLNADEPARIDISGARFVANGSGGVVEATLPELPEGFIRINYRMLQPLEGDPATAVPPAAYEADGKDVLLKGYMYPGSEQEGIVQFLLVRDQGDCCFGGNPKITDRVLVTLGDTNGIDFTPRLVKIAGQFTIRPAGSPEIDGGVLYHLEDAFVR